MVTVEITQIIQIESAIENEEMPKDISSLCRPTEQEYSCWRLQRLATNDWVEGCQM